MTEVDLTQHKHGDRFDGVFLGKVDPMHLFMPLLYPNRCDNEGYIAEVIDLTNLAAYLEKKNQGKAASNKEAKGMDDAPLTAFQVVVAAFMKTLILRPKLNYFIANKKMYARRTISASFVVKKQFSDKGGEGLAIIKPTGEDTLDTIHRMILEQMFECRKEGATDSSSESMEMVGKLPMFLVRFVAWACCKLDMRGKVPRSFIASDPYYTSVVLSNLGSIGLHSGYHHLTNWGTNSIFCIVGERKKRPFFEEDGTYQMRDSLELGITIDERLADGYYYSKSIRLLRTLLENPELLELPLSEEVEF